jgi:hypothetical protein
MCKLRKKDIASDPHAQTARLQAVRNVSATADCSVVRVRVRVTSGDLHRAARGSASGGDGLGPYLSLSAQSLGRGHAAGGTDIAMHPQIQV